MSDGSLVSTPKGNIWKCPQCVIESEKCVGCNKKKELVLRYLPFDHRPKSMKAAESVKDSLLEVQMCRKCFSAYADCKNGGETLCGWDWWSVVDNLALLIELHSS